MVICFSTIHFNKLVMAGHGLDNNEFKPSNPTNNENQQCVAFSRRQVNKKATLSSLREAAGLVMLNICVYE